MDWKFFYVDGSTTDSDTATKDDVQTWGIAAIVQPEPIRLGREILNRWECYFHDGVAWRGTDFRTVIDRLLHQLPVEGYCEGTTPDRATFKALYTAAHDDPAFPEKVAYSHEESPNVGVDAEMEKPGTLEPVKVIVKG